MDRALKQRLVDLRLPAIRAKMLMNHPYTLNGNADCATRVENFLIQLAETLVGF